jgi:hypothetical protein
VHFSPDSGSGPSNVLITSAITPWNNAGHAVNEFNKFVDYGLASEYSTVNLSEPSGRRPALKYSLSQPNPNEST